MPASSDRERSTLRRYRRFLLQLLIVVGVVAAVLGVLAGLQLWWYLDRTTVAEVESMVGQNLAPGATTEEVFAFLDNKGISHGSVHPVDGSSYLLEEGYHPDTKVIGAWIYGTSTSFIIEGDIQILFILDDDGLLKEYLVREVFTGP
jgi:hypothetical protein